MAQLLDVHDDMENKPYICIIGCGSVGKLLIERLSESWHLLIIDKNKNLANNFEKYYESGRVTFFLGDATSYLFLKGTNIQKAYHILICIDNDEVVGEIIHILLKRMMIHNITAQITDENLAENLKKKGIIVVYAPHIMVNFIINQMPIGQNIATYVGKGEGEIIQIQLTKSSPLVGLPLSQLPPSKWIVGAIYRPKLKISLISQISYIGRLQVAKDDKLIIPRGNVIPKVGDKLLLIGDSHILKSTVQYLKAGTPVFPKRHGDTVISLFLDIKKNVSAYKQYKWLIKNMEPSNMQYFYNSKIEKSIFKKMNLFNNEYNLESQSKRLHQIRLNNVPKLISQIANKQRIGLIIYIKPFNFITNLIHRLFLISNLIKLIRQHDTPLWIINKNYEIKSITLFVYANEGVLRAAELAIDAAIKLKLTIKAIQVNPPSIIASKKQLDRSKEVMQAIREISALYGITIQEIIREGNPVDEIIRRVNPSELLVLSLPQKNQEQFLIPNSSYSIYKKFSGSLLLLAT